MTVTEVDLAPWERLGDMLASRRGQLKPEYRNRRVFAEEAGINYRVVFDVEHGRRSNYGRQTLAALERAYWWRPGSVAAVLGGGAPEPLVPTIDLSTVPDVPADVGFAALEEWERHVWMTPGLTVEERALAIKAVRLLRESTRAVEREAGEAG